MSIYVPKRFMGRTGYQIFVDRFCRKGEPPEAMEGRILKSWDDAQPNWKPAADGEYYNNEFYAGNLKGIIEKLDYLADMGFNFIYHSPISKTPSSHHYDVEDQTKIDTWIGTKEDYQELCEEAHKRDILICPDLVFNHMGVQSEIFQEALHNPKSKYHDWFEWDAHGNPVFWYGFKTMPQCNKLNPDYMEYACDVCEFYLKMGADGIRLDLGETFPKEFMRKIRERVKKVNSEALIVVEMWDFATHKENPQIYGDQTDSVMNYPLSDAICRLVRYRNEKHFLYTWQELSGYPEQVQDVLWNFLDTHDTPRAANMLAGMGLENPFAGRIWDIEEPWRKRDAHGNVIEFETFGFRKTQVEADKHLDKELARERVMLASFMQYSARGTPVVYYGTEAGLTGGKDPGCRKPYPWGKEDLILQSHYKKLGRFRKKYKGILAQGKWNVAYLSDEIVVYERCSNDRKLVYIINCTDEKQKCFYHVKNGNVALALPESTPEVLGPYGGLVYEVKN